MFFFPPYDFSVLSFLMWPSGCNVVFVNRW